MIDIVTILMMSAEIGYSRSSQNKGREGYDVIISVHDVTNKILSRDSNYIVEFGFSMRDVIISLTL